MFSTFFNDFLKAYKFLNKLHHKIHGDITLSNIRNKNKENNETDISR